MASKTFGLSRGLKRRLAASPLFDLYRGFHRSWDLYRWRRGVVSHPPPAIKHHLVGSFAGRFETSVLVETGTFFGDMLQAHRRTFRQLYSIELDPWLARRARRRFAHHRNIELLEGDSAELLPSLLRQIEEPCLFWLDAHAMVGGVRGGGLTPVVAELTAILEAGFPSSVILIDDARLFTGTGDYPSIQEIRDLVRAYPPDRECEIRDDVVLIYPSCVEGSGGELQYGSNSTPSPSARRLTKPK